MTILVFPSALVASTKFAEEARRWGRRTVGASSIENDASAAAFDAWSHLPFIGDPGFFDALAALVAREQITELFTPHAPSFRLLERELPARIPGLALIGPGPFRRQMDRVLNALEDGKAGLAQARDYAQAELPYGPEFLAGVLLQAENIHGECSREKILALAGIVPSAPQGDVVEIGALYGKSSYVLNRVAAHCGVGATLCIDPWRLDQAVQFDSPEHIQDMSSGWDWDVIYTGFLIGMLGCTTGGFNYLRATSAAASAAYAASRTVRSAEFGETTYAGEIAVLHLDGNHDEAAVEEDFRLWGPRVRPGGWVIFDDYVWSHGDGPRKVADRAIAAYGPRVKRSFVAGAAMFVKLAD